MIWLMLSIFSFLLIGIAVYTMVFQGHTARLRHILFVEIDEVTEQDIQDLITPPLQTVRIFVVPVLMLIFTAYLFGIGGYWAIAVVIILLFLIKILQKQLFWQLAPIIYTEINRHMQI